MPKTKCKEQDPEQRIKNFSEVALGYTEAEAVKEAARCLDCKKPYCVSGCPVEIDIPHFIRLIKERRFDESAQVLRDKNNLPAVCGRVCPQETQCEKVCILSKKGEPVAIGKLERFAADWNINKTPSFTKTSDGRQEHKVTRHKKDTKNQNKKIAVVGSGPAGLTCSADLARMGYDVTVFESLHKPGGVLVYGIPEFRLPKRIVDLEVDYIKSLGVNISVNMVIGKTLLLDDLKDDNFDAFFIATGAGLPYFLGIEDENLNGVYSANEFLTRTNLMKSHLFPEYDTPVTVGRRTAVIGAGNVAFDAARCALRLGSEEVVMIYRRSRQEMPARDEEIEHALEEGIKFELLTHPVRIVGSEDGWVRGVECMRNSLGDPDESGRRRPIPIKNSEFSMEIDTVICAIGQGPNPLLLNTIDGLKLTGKGTIEADFITGRTSMPQVFAGGDIVTGAATVIEAMGAGKRAARS
ncbi:MAG: NADPH-dependent glutamate synthase, partial [Candidatus Omnitrophota bacterium]